MTGKWRLLMGAIILCTQTISAQIYSVNTTDDTNDGVCNATHCSLREAINSANADNVANLIQFNLPGSAPFIFQPTTPLPFLSEANTRLEGHSQPGFAPGDIVLDGSLLNNGDEDGLVVTAGGIDILGLVIRSFPANGILINGADGVKIGAADPAQGNTLVANGAAGLAISNGARNTTVSGNLISGNQTAGIFGRDASGLSISANRIGTDVSGNLAMPNAGSGIDLADVQKVQIGEPPARNVISGNLGSGISLQRINRTDSLLTTIQHNFIGVAANGVAKLANGFDGVELRNALGVLIGGETAGTGNLISGNTLMGIRATGSSGLRILANWVGTDSTGLKALGNGTNGINLTDCTEAQVGSEQAGNLVAGNRVDGIFIARTDINLTGQNIEVTGNRVGTDRSGTLPLGNLQNGIHCFQLAGGAVLTANLVGDNNRGISLSSCANLEVKENFVGVDLTGTLPLGNRIAGITTLNCRQILIGGETAGAANTIAFNRVGVLIGVNSRSCRISRNRFFNNTDAGIEIFPASNEDVGAPAFICVFPDEIKGSAPPNARIEVFQYGDGSNADGPCQGMLYLGTALANGSGDWSLPGIFTLNTVYTATATDENDNTSIFLECIPARERPQAIAMNTGPYCEDSPIVLQGDANLNGASFSWTGPNNFVSARQNPTNATVPGPYVLTIQQGGCTSAPDTTIVEITTTINIKIGDDPSEWLCPGEQRVINGRIFDQNNPSGVERVSGAGNACDTVYTVNLPFFPAAESFIDSILCEGGQVLVNGQVFDENRPSGMITLPGGAASGCDSLISVNLAFYDPPTSRIDTILCRGSSFVFNGTIYDELNRQGTEILPAASEKGCDSLINISIGFFPQAIGMLDTLICEGAQLVFNGTIYDANNLSGTEVLPGASRYGCDSLIEVRLRLRDQPQSRIDTTLCRGGRFTYDGVVYDENNPSGQLAFPAAGADACDSLVFIQLNFLDPPEINLNNTLCRGQFVLVNGVRYDENNPVGTEMLAGQAGQCDTTVRVNFQFINEISFELKQTLCPGENLVVNGRVYDAANPRGTERIPGGSVMGCDSVIVVDLRFLAPAEFRLKETLCPGEFIEVNGKRYDEANPAGREVISGGSFLGCDSTIVINLQFSGLKIMVKGEEAGCKPEARGAVLIESISGGSGPFVYSLDGAAAQPIGNLPFRIENVAPGNHRIVISDADGCETSTAISIAGAGGAFVDLGPDQRIKAGDSIELSVLTSLLLPTRIQWTPAEGLSCADCLAPVASPARSLTYTLTLQNAEGCEASDQIRVTVEEPSLVFVPNAFSPNGDGENETLVVYGDLKKVNLIKRFQVFDRWGTLLFEGRDFTPGNEGVAWDGLERGGRPAPAGIYIYVLEAELTSGNSLTDNGSVLLVR